MFLAIALFAQERSAGYRLGQVFGYIVFFGLAALAIWGIVALCSRRRSQPGPRWIPRDWVEPKARATWELLRHVARSDAWFEPSLLCETAEAAFTGFQRCWEAADLTRLHDVLTSRFYNCIRERYDDRPDTLPNFDELRLDRPHIVHFVARGAADQHAFAALMTTRGDHADDDRQEFWTFHRHDDCWRLARIDSAYNLESLRAANQAPPVIIASLQGDPKAGELLEYVITETPPPLPGSDAMRVSPIDPSFQQHPLK